MIKATITTQINVAIESPFCLLFGIEAYGDPVVAALMGDQARALHGSLQVGDEINISGRFMDGSHMGHRSVFYIRDMEAPRVGVRVNVYA